MYDKLLHARIGRAVVEATSPWQGSGRLVAEDMAWMLSEIFALRRAQFLDRSTYLTLLADSADMLQKALTIASAWAASINMKLNIGENKSAVIVCGRNHLRRTAQSHAFHVNGHVLPKVRKYKYLGVVLSDGGSWMDRLSLVKERTLKRIGELVAWYRQRGVTLDIAETNWRLYVERAVTFGLVMTADLR